MLVSLRIILESYLGKKAAYQGVDIVARDRGFLVCDLNSQPITLDLLNYDTVILSGVLEYVYDISYVFNYFFEQGIDHLLFSYACSDVCKQDRLLNGWLSDFTWLEINKNIVSSGFELEKNMDWKDQNLFICHRVKS